MNVYIEYVIIDNFVLTYTIGLLSYKALKTKNSVLRNVISAAAGTVCAVFYPFMRLQFLWLLLVRLGLLILLSLILFYKKSKFLISLSVFLGITFLFGGVFFGIGYAVYGDAEAALTLPAIDFPIGVILLLAGVLYLFFKRLFIKFHKNRDAKGSIYKIEIEALNKKLCMEGFCDTGNRVFDSKTGLPVAILCFKQTSNLLGAEAFIKLIGGDTQESYKNARYIEYLPYGGKPQKLWLLKPERFLLYFDKDKNIDIDVMLGLSLHSFGDTADYGLIFGPAVSSKFL